jgi:hypothetical protein
MPKVTNRDYADVSATLQHLNTVDGKRRDYLAEIEAKGKTAKTVAEIGAGAKVESAGITADGGKAQAITRAGATVGAAEITGRYRLAAAQIMSRSGEAIAKMRSGDTSLLVKVLKDSTDLEKALGRERVDLISKSMGGISAPGVKERVVAIEALQAEVRADREKLQTEAQRRALEQPAAGTGGGSEVTTTTSTSSAPRGLEGAGTFTPMTDAETRKATTPTAPAKKGGKPMSPGAAAALAALRTARGG